MPAARRDVLRGAGALFALTAAGGLGGCGVGDTVKGEVTAALGWTLAQVAERSSLPIDLSRTRDDDALMLNVPLAFRYAGAPELRFPPTRLLSIRTTATILTSIEFAPQLDAAELDAALRLAAEASAQADAAGWRPVAGAAVTGPQEVALQAGDPAGREDRSWTIGERARGDARLILGLRRISRAGSGGLFLLNLDFRDDELAMRTGPVARRLREADGLAGDVPRAVDARAYGPRALAELDKTNRIG